MDGNEDDDVMAGDNAIIIRRTDLVSPRFRTVNADNGRLYELTSNAVAGLADVDVGYVANVTSLFQEHQDMELVRTVYLLDHDESTEEAALTTGPHRFGNDVMVGGLHDDEMFGQLGDDIVQGDGACKSLLPPKPAWTTMIRLRMPIPALIL